MLCCAPPPAVQIPKFWPKMTRKIGIMQINSQFWPINDSNLTNVSKTGSVAIPLKSNAKDLRITSFVGTLWRQIAKVLAKNYPKNWYNANKFPVLADWQYILTSKSIEDEY